MALSSEQVIGGGWRTRFEWGRSFADPTDYFGSLVHAPGDLDGDGAGDVVTSKVYWATGYWDIRAFSGRDGRVLWSQSTGVRWDTYTFLRSSIVADLDGDGVNELAVGDIEFGNSTGRVLIHSGATGILVSEIHPITTDMWAFGWSIADVGDVDLDGVPDLLIGAPLNPYSGSAFVHSGRTGQFLRQYLPPPVSYSRWAFGQSVGAIADLDGDSFADHLIGTGSSRSNGVDSTGQIFVYSGGSGALLLDIRGEGEEWLGRGDLLGAPDLDGDTTPDFLVAFPGRAPLPLEIDSYVLALSGATGERLWKCSDPVSYSSGGSFLGRSIALDRDWTGDGVPEILAGAPHNILPTHVTYPAPGRIFLLDGASGHRLRSFGAGDAADGFGYSLAVVSPSPLYPRGAIAVGSPLVHTPTLGDGAVYLLEFEPGLAANTGQISATAGGTIVLNLEFPKAAAGHAFRVLASATGTGPLHLGHAAVPLSRDGLLERTLHATGAWNLGRLDSRGDATLTWSIAPGLLLPWLGRTLWLAAVEGETTVDTSSVAVGIEVVQ